eukprot:Seg7644.1 transcript_id=Seg7644.1/GoldUCD/mRNA.D3Y31 product="UPF0696 protein C11orf68" protein_id=Seg7644.1/GoldUCD/D3Y31
MAEAQGDEGSKQIVGLRRNVSDETVKKTEEWINHIRDTECNRKWIKFDCRTDNPKKNLERWLFLKNPERADGEKEDIAWICISGKNYKESAGEPDLEGLDSEWEEMSDSKDELMPKISYQLFANLGKKYNVTSGKWLIFPRHGTVETIWNAICRDIATDEGNLPKAGCFSAKINPVGKEKKGHVICVYNDDFDNKDVVMAVESALRRIINPPMKMTYKPDLFTYIGIYGGNEFGLPPFIYSSDWDRAEQRFVVTSVYP